MAKWQYQVVSFSLATSQANIERDLNARGGKGWEIVSVVPRRQGTATSPGAIVAVLKKPA